MKNQEMILYKESGLIECDAPLTVLQEKLYNGLLYHARKTMFYRGEEYWQENPGSNYSNDVSYDHIKNKFEIGLNELARISNDKTINSSEAQARIVELMSIKAEYNILQKDKNNEWTSFVLIPEVSVVGGRVFYSLPPWYFEKLKLWKIKGSPAPFAKVNMKVQSLFNSRYALRLYQVLLDFYGSPYGIPTIDLAELRRILGITIKKFKRFIDFKKNCLKQALDEINSNPLINFNVDYFVVRSGQTPTGIKFKIQNKKDDVNTVHLTYSNILSEKDKEYQEVSESSMTNNHSEHVHVTYSNTFSQKDEQNQKVKEKSMTENKVNSVYLTESHTFNQKAKENQELIKKWTPTQELKEWAEKFILEHPNLPLEQIEKIKKRYLR